MEVIEKKGIGHPDTLADSMAEALSYVYSQYCLKKFGYILHHNVDKISVYGGSSKAGFGFGESVKPIRIIVNGRMSTAFGSTEIPVFELASDVVKKYIKKVIPSLTIDKDIEVFDFLNKAEGTATKGWKWFRPTSEHDLPELTLPRANDTSCVVGYYPLSKVEKLSLSLHNLFFNSRYEKKYDYLGTDIKVMISRIGQKYDITMCVPFLGKHTPNIEFYTQRKKELTENIMSHIYSELGDSIDLDFALNTVINLK
jgi:S-adenosylmethionine synthetase